MKGRNAIVLQAHGMRSEAGPIASKWTRGAHSGLLWTCCPHIHLQWRHLDVDKGLHLHSSIFWIPIPLQRKVPRAHAAHSQRSDDAGRGTKSPAVHLAGLARVSSTARDGKIELAERISLQFFAMRLLPHKPPVTHCCSDWELAIGRLHPTVGSSNAERLGREQSVAHRRCTQRVAVTWRQLARNRAQWQRGAEGCGEHHGRARVYSPYKIHLVQGALRSAIIKKCASGFLGK